jgi:hypothetical protein
MAKATNQLSDIDKRKQAERILLDSWHHHIKSAMQNLHKKFHSDTKFILTESDLKCWLFYYLQPEKPFIPFAVHTEVTHYAKHTVSDKKTQEETIEKKHKFRDLSLLCPWEIKANEDFIKQTGNHKNILSKGFKHNANAIHFELKFVRETGSSNEIDGLKEDIDKLKSYIPNSESPIRHFVIICGTRSKKTKVDDFINAVKSEIGNKTDAVFIERVRFYLFDKEKIVCVKLGKNGELENILK